MSPGAASSFSAAEVALTEGDTERALTLLEEARQHHPDARTRGKIELLGARIEMWSDGLGAHERLLTEAARVERDDRTLAAAMLAEAAYLVQGEDDELAEVLARRGGCPHWPFGERLGQIDGGASPGETRRPGSAGRVLSHDVG